MDGDDGLGYGDDLPQVDEEDDQGDGGAPDGDEEGSKKLQEMEEELAKLKAMQEKVKMEVSSGQDTGAAASGVPNLEAREEVDGRSIYVGNVDYAVSPEQLQQHFQGCGTVNRVTILADKFGNPKGFAYVEFADSDAVGNALLLNESELNSRKIRVQAKRTNVPGMRPRPPMRGRGRGPRGGGGGGGFPMMYPFTPYVLPAGVGGYMPYMGGRRGRGRRYSPYQ